MKQRTRPRFLDDLARALRWHRRTLAAAAAALAVFCGLLALGPADGAAVGVVAAARDLPGGTALTSADLVEVRLPAEAVPAGAATDPAAVTGRSINAPLSRLSVVTEVTVAGGQSLARSGYVVAALPLSDAALATLVQPGSRIDIIGPDKDAVAVLASDVRVVATPAPSAEFGGGSADRVALVEVTPAVATRLAAASQAGGVTLAVR